MKLKAIFFSIAAAAMPMLTAAEAEVAIERNDSSAANRGFGFDRVPPPAKNDAGAGAKFSLVDGQGDANGGGLPALNDGQLPRSEDEPTANFFFAAGTRGGRILADLGQVIEVKQVNTYSWHPAGRGPQVYRLLGSDAEVAPTENDWKLLAQIDTRGRRANREPGGQYGVSVSAEGGSLGRFKFLLFQVEPTSSDDAFAQTFFSEIDVIDAVRPAPEPIGSDEPPRDIVTVETGKYELNIDITETPDLKDWVQAKLAPVVKEWYPKLVEMLPSEGYEAPEKVSIQFLADMRGVANASGTRIRCAARWMRQNLDGEAVGAVVHELVHVVQQYGRGRRDNPTATRTPGWVVEGVPDYIRWFIYEPQTKGAEITERNLERARYDANYRITANFIDWVVRNHDPELLPKLNAVGREARYREELWKEWTGKNLQELGEQWRAEHERRLKAAN